MAISISVNGEPRAARAGDTLSDLVRALELDPERLAIELDRRIVKRAQWSLTVLPAAGSTPGGAPSPSRLC